MWKWQLCSCVCLGSVFPSELELVISATLLTIEFSDTMLLYFSIMRYCWRLASITGLSFRMLGSTRLRDEANNGAERRPRTYVDSRIKSLKPYGTWIWQLSRSALLHDSASSVLGFPELSGAMPARWCVIAVISNPQHSFRRFSQCVGLITCWAVE